jgi:hypothetical protein
MNVNVLTSLIAAGSATGGVALKIAYDSLTEKAKQRRARSDRYIDERKAAYDDFWTRLKAVEAYNERLHELSLIARARLEVKPEVLTDFPSSPLPDLISALETIRRLARTHLMVEVCENIVALSGDAAAAMRIYQTETNLSYGLPYFLAMRLREDRAREFIAAYRKDLGIGLPEGAPKTYPIAARPWPPEFAEGHLRLHLRAAKQISTAPEPDAPMTALELTKQDHSLLQSPRFKALLLPPDPDS